MAKFLEAPVKPQVIHAVQFTGIENGAPEFNEPVPAWLFAPMLRGSVSMSGGHLVHDGVSVPVGAWFMVDDGDVAGHTLRFAPAEQFFAAFRPARKRAVRKPKVQLNVAAE